MTPSQATYDRGWREGRRAERMCNGTATQADRDMTDQEDEGMSTDDGTYPRIGSPRETLNLWAYLLYHALPGWLTGRTRHERDLELAYENGYEAGLSAAARRQSA